MATRRRCQNFFASLSAAVRGRRNFRSLFVRACAGCCIAASPKTQGRFRTIHKGSPQNVRDFCPNLVMKYSAKSMQPGLAWLFLGCPPPIVDVFYVWSLTSLSLPPPPPSFPLLAVRRQLLVFRLRLNGGFLHRPAAAASISVIGPRKSLVASVKVRSWHQVDQEASR